MAGMLLAIDVGNTQTHIGAFDGDELLEHWRFATDGEDTADQLAVRVASMLGLRGSELDEVEPRSSARSSRGSTPSTRG